MMKIFNFKPHEKTKWIGIHAYQYGYDEYMVFARLDKTTGLFEFKTKLIARNTEGTISAQMPINANAQFSALCNKL